jgi:hypothetical protein
MKYILPFLVVQNPSPYFYPNTVKIKKINNYILIWASEWEKYFPSEVPVWNFLTSLNYLKENTCPPTSGSLKEKLITK